ncbi:MAG: hypothetical protein H7Y02_08475, partial [Candidatus Obscuribacterales bacterium]|nr:hypothetical protein [Steroidobacteraceae bacterium]
MSAALKAISAPAILVVSDAVNEAQALAAKLDLAKQGVANCAVIVAASRTEAIQHLAA